MMMQYIPVPQIDYATLTVVQHTKNHDRGHKIDETRDFVKFNFEHLNNRIK